MRDRFQVIELCPSTRQVGQQSATVDGFRKSKLTRCSKGSTENARVAASDCERTASAMITRRTVPRKPLVEPPIIQSCYAPPIRREALLRTPGRRLRRSAIGLICKGSCGSTVSGHLLSAPNSTYMLRDFRTASASHLTLANDTPIEPCSIQSSLD